LVLAVLAFGVIRLKQLHQILRPLRLRFAVRRILAAALALAVLATFAPLSASAGSHTCSMPCCASGSCSTGACDVPLKQPAQTAQPESHCEHGHESLTEASKITVRAEPEGAQDASELCGADSLLKPSGHPVEQTAPLHETSVKSEALTRPCGTDCCAGAYASSQGRRSRELALLNHASRPRAPAPGLTFKRASHPLFLSAQWRRQSSPRAPPGSFINA
jgi:hypothetical protein